MRKYFPAFVIFISVVLITLIGYFITLNNFRSAVQREFEQSAIVRVVAIQDSLREKFLILESIHSLYSAFQGIPQPEFRTFVQPFESELEGVQAFQWIVPVTDADRENFEAARQEEGITEYQITERLVQGEMVRANQRAVYYPVFPAQPIDEGELSIGFDLGSDPVRLEALERATDIGDVVLSARVNLVQEQSEDEYGFILFQPVYAISDSQNSSTENQEVLLGLVMGVFRISDIVDAALNQLAAEVINIKLFDESASSSERDLYSYSPLTLQTRQSGRSEIAPFIPTEYMRSFEIGGRTWSIVASAPSQYMAGRQAIISISILVVGLIFSVLLSSYLILSIRQAIKEKEIETELRVVGGHLLRAQKMNAIGQLTGGIAHDFNNILQSILGYCQLAIMNMGKNKQKDLTEYLGNIQYGVERAQKMIAQMMLFSRSSPVQSSPQSLPQLVGNVLKLLRPSIPIFIDIDSTLPDKLPKVMIDPVQFEQIIMNLCINARDAIDGKGTIQIELRQTQLEKSICNSCHETFMGDFIELIVKDSGKGISSKEILSIFDPFYSTKIVGEGTGMGLSMVHGITHNFGGHIWVESTPGKGSAFHLLFPVSESEVQPDINFSEQPEEVPLSAQQNRTGTIMVVDDDPAIAEYLNRLLTMNGYKTLITTSSREAWSIFETTDQIDLVITDMTMPELSGLELATKILKLSAEMPIILCSGNITGNDDDAAKEAGIKVHLHKPIASNILLSKIDEMLTIKANASLVDLA